ncbi:MAG: 50S ribosomal protein L15 [Spirochaetes bacterium ADurb.Bin315]|jgi:large subunit ribosomal protein L15|nr:50S ribosomal protein L15 [Spirochaetota bacterium]OQA41327.1 MAG: 50S ribosomal protein L15 [Spirochaetes bacterium ADurb.Bin315]TAH58507.1 MAG: 50S ribosomal protein L15 [Sphaerochaeta sp.]HOE88748.1 50S ribosomal protein L15 [Sphaerochaeta sp.]HOR79568.1 50S ribosomal protein L15 [Sphaerochaeta sp.]
MAKIIAPKGANTKKTILGRGASSKGRTSGRGHDGQNSRSGGGTRPGFEGGQMPLYRRVARRGFSNEPFKVVYEVVSLDDISRVFNDGDVVTLAALKELGVVKGVKTQAKILNNGELTKKVIIEGLKVSASAIEAIKAAGGQIR